MKSFKSFYEDLTFKVEVEGLPAMWMSGNSPGQVKNHLRKLVKQPSMIKSVKRQTKFDVKKMYRDKAQGKEVDEMTQQSKTHPNLKIAVGKSAQSAKDTKARADKRKANKQGTSLAAGTACESTVKDNRPDHEIMQGSQGDARRKHDAVHGHGSYHKLPAHQREKLHRKEIDQRFSDRGRKPPKYTVKHTGNKVGHVGSFEIHHTPLQKVRNHLRTPTRTEATSGEVDYGTDKSVKIMKKVTPNEAQEGKGLWANIHAKRKRGERMRKKGEKGAPTPAAIKSAQKEDVTEKLTIGKIRKAAYKTAKVLGDVNAVKKGKVARRVKNRVVGKMLGKAVSKLGLFR